MKIADKMENAIVVNMVHNGRFATSNVPKVGKTKFDKLITNILNQKKQEKSI